MSAWNASGYEQHHSFVWRYGESLIELLAPQPGERILDLGCGTGQLTAQLASTGAMVVGLDQDSNMLAKAREHYPDIEFVQADAADFDFSEPFDAVFSNAALHWMLKPKAVLDCVSRALKPGGRFIAEMGGEGNIARIEQAIVRSLDKFGRYPGNEHFPWYFPSVAEYGTLLERAGFDIQAMWHYPRLTPLDGGEGAMANWVDLFASRLFERLDESQHERVMGLLQDMLRPELYKDGSWSVDYVRLRFVAIKIDRGNPMMYSSPVRHVR